MLAVGGITGVSGDGGAPIVSFLTCPNLPLCKAGDLFEGTVFDRPRPLDGVVGIAGLPGLGAPFECLEWRELVDLLRRILPSLDTLSAPALALDADLCTPDFRDVPGVAGVMIAGVPCWTSWTVFSSAAVPCIPMRK